MNSSTIKYQNLKKDAALIIRAHE